MIVVPNPEGLHLRAATEVAKLLRQFSSRVELIRVKDERRAEGTNVLQVLTLGAAQGEELLLEAMGGDANEALEALAGLFGRCFGEE